MSTVQQSSYRLRRWMFISRNVVFEMKLENLSGQSFQTDRQRAASLRAQMGSPSKLINLLIKESCVLDGDRCRSGTKRARKVRLYGNLGDSTSLCLTMFAHSK